MTSAILVLLGVAVIGLLIISIHQYEVTR